MHFKFVPAYLFFTNSVSHSRSFISENPSLFKTTLPFTNLISILYSHHDMPGNVHFADMVSLVSNQGIITACDLPKILEEIRRRDNIEDFILGLVKVEVFPFPEGQKTAKPALIPFKEVTINEAKSAELTTVTYARVDHDLGHVKVITQILSEAAPGSYSEEREVIPITRDALTIDQARSLRSALFARYEWVTSKIANVNEMRRLHCERAQDLLVSPSSPLPDEADEEDVDSNLDEELDPEMMGVEVRRRTIYFYVVILHDSRMIRSRALRRTKTKEKKKLTSSFL